jgi:hypothetical protein
MKTPLLLWATATGLALSVARAEMLTAVPMQGSMVMPMVSYHTDTDSLSVMMPTTIPQLTPLLISNPGDSFDPADPWFDSLDPSHQGASFSRRYGFVMDGNSDLLPSDREMWIRILSGSPELKVYLNMNNEPKVWDPIFSTDGSSTELHWNGMMFHPAFTAPPGTNDLAATFEVLLVDTATGEEVPNSSSGPLVFNWTNVSDGRPQLGIAQSVVVSWPLDTSTNWVLESASSPDVTDWKTVTNTPVMVDGTPCVILQGDEPQLFYRMRYVP